MFLGVGFMLRKAASVQQLVDLSVSSIYQEELC